MGELKAEMGSTEVVKTLATTTPTEVGKPNIPLPQVKTSQPEPKSLKNRVTLILAANLSKVYALLFAIYNYCLKFFSNPESPAVTPGGDEYVDPTPYQPVEHNPKHQKLSETLLFRQAQHRSLEEVCEGKSSSSDEEYDLSESFIGDLLGLEGASETASRSEIERQGAELLVRVDEQPVTGTYRKSLIRRINEIVFESTWGMQDEAQEVSFGSFNQFDIGGTLACTYCASLFLAYFLNTDHPTSRMGGDAVDRIVHQGAEYYKALGSEGRYVDFLEVEQRLRTLEAPLLPLEDVKAVSSNYVETMVELSCENPIDSYQHIVEHHLYKNGKGLILTVHGYTFAIGRRNDCYFVFDSHGSRRVFRNSHAFLAKFREAEELAEFLSRLYPPDNNMQTQSLSIAAATIEEYTKQLQSVEITRNQAGTIDEETLLSFYQLNQEVIDQIVAMLIEYFPQMEGRINTATLEELINFFDQSLLDHPNNRMLMIAQIVMFKVNAVMLTPVRYNGS